VDTRIVRLDLAYDGSGFRGWASQGDPAIRTVAGELGDHLERILRERPSLAAAGRTDAGVHARGQVASFATASAVPPDRLAAALNAALAPEVVIARARYAPTGFDARSSASAREYTYRINTAPVPDPFTGRFVWHRPGPLSIGAIRRAASALVGEHDFASFGRAPGPGRSTRRHLMRCSAVRDAERIEITMRANAFLQQMVRAVVGTLVAVGEGRLAPQDVAAILEARDRAAAAPVAPPGGLTLERVIYGRRRHP
jgi:tRNA pseudouridine38-40 synthase